MSRRLFSALSLAVVALAATLIPAAPAAAKAGDLLCFAAFQLNFDPPLQVGGTSNINRSNAFLDSCTSPNGNFPELRSATVEVLQGTAIAAPPFNPCSLVFFSGGTGIVFWQNGQVTLFNFTVSTNPGSGSIGANAQLTAGAAAPNPTVVLPGLATINADCLFAGLKFVAVPLAVNIVG